ATAGKRQLSGMRPQRVRSFGDEQVGSVLTLAEEHQDRGRYRRRRWYRHAGGQRLGGDAVQAARDRSEPTRQRIGGCSRQRPGLLGLRVVRHSPTPRYSRTSAVRSAYFLYQPRFVPAIDPSGRTKIVWG